MNSPIKITISALAIILLSGFPAKGQLKLGGSQSEINFREGPGLNSRILNTVSSSNLLVILPGEPANGYVQVFDIETNSFGYVYENLISITDTLYFQKQNYFERSDRTGTGDIVIELINRTDHRLFVWINRKTYNLEPYEKKDLVFSDEDITYFSSSPGLYPVFGREVLKQGYTYLWDFSL
jgi:uncharacterized protein YgiM (DUF1202 family)